MEVINPIIIAGGRQMPPAPGSGICAAQAMYSNYSQMMPIVYYGTVVQVVGPLLYILKPGDYTLQDHAFDASLLEPYGVTRGVFNNLYIAGNVYCPGPGKYLNFCGIYNKSQDPTYMRGIYYAGEKKYERSLPIIQGEGSRAAVPLTSMYGGYADSGLISLEDLRKPWTDYSTLNLFYMHLEE